MFWRKLAVLQIAEISNSTSFNRDVAIEYQRLLFSVRSNFGEGININRISRLHITLSLLAPRSLEMILTKDAKLLFASRSK